MKTSLPSLLIAATGFVGLASEAHAVTYLNTNFDQEDITGPVTLSGASNFTGMLQTGTGANATIEENRTTSSTSDVQPSGQHLRIDGNNQKHATMENAMTLTTDNFTSFNISFSLLMAGDPDKNVLRIHYSSLGDFSDAVTLSYYVIDGSALDTETTITDDTGTELGRTVVTEDFWSQESITLTNSDVTFSDTAKVRFLQDTGASTSSAFYLDDIVIAGVPEPSTAILGVIGSLLLLRRRR